MTECKHPASPLGEARRARDSVAPDSAPADKVLSIDNVAEMFSVSRLVLYYCELRGLVRRRHRIGQTRVYGWADCERIAFIIKCRQAGLPLRDIVSIVKASDVDDVATGTFLTGQERCMALVDQLERRRKEIDEALGELAHIHSLLSAKLGSDHGSDRT